MTEASSKHRRHVRGAHRDPPGGDRGTAVIFTYLSYTAARRPTPSASPRLERPGGRRDAKVAGVSRSARSPPDIAYIKQGRHGAVHQAVHHIRPAPARIAGNTSFGAKSVEFTTTRGRSQHRAAGSFRGCRKDVQLEMRHPVPGAGCYQQDRPGRRDLNATLTALGEPAWLFEDASSVASRASTVYLLNPKLHRPCRTTAKAARRQHRRRGGHRPACRRRGDRAGEGEDAFIVDNVPALNKTIVDEKTNLNATLLAATGLANNGTATPAAADDCRAIQRAPLKVASDYSPEFGCVLKGVSMGCS